MDLHRACHYKRYTAPGFVPWTSRKKGYSDSQNRPKVRKSHITVSKPVGVSLLSAIIIDETDSIDLAVENMSLMGFKMHKKESPKGNVTGNHDTRIIGNLRIPKGFGMRLHQDIAWLRILNGFLNRREKSLGND
ncbi:hypothetical protein L2E82_32407 [Cichorium intybus]|uniref:Uncharacterized protein n=1 Tax=Cichorium intybus TaxID=13427 RepID=A0ACB9BG84_CICIN|nr:hypothetical protein L2E82_32407 [Cichorium intybus]